MPSHETIPTIQQMLDAANAELWTRRPIADLHSGSVRNVHAGVGGMLWIREANRDRANFRKVYTDTCENSDLDWRIYRFGGPPRVEATKGTGTALVSRASTTGGQGTFWKGTRIAIAALGQAPRFYRVAADTLIEASHTGALIPIEAETAGTGSAIDSVALNAPRMYLEDPVWDSSWQVLSLKCSDGTKHETDAEYRARWRQSKLDRRPGYRKAISDAMVAQGAAFVALFESGHFGTDDGVNRIFVADSSWQSPPLLLNKCRMALDSVSVAGCDTQVAGVVRTETTFALTAHLWDEPGRVNQAAVRAAVQDGVLHYLSSRDNAMLFRRDGLIGDVLQACPAVQSVDFATPLDTDAADILNGSLKLLYTDRALITVTLTGPV